MTNKIPYSSTERNKTQGTRPKTAPVVLLAYTSPLSPPRRQASAGASCDNVRRGEGGRIHAGTEQQAGHMSRTGNRGDFHITAVVYVGILVVGRHGDGRV